MNMQILIAVILAVIIVIFSLRYKMLTKSGAVAAFLLAVLVFGFGGWAWAIPLLAFFFLSSFLSKTGKEKKQKFKNTFEKTGVRDWGQVAANGGLPGLFVFLYALTPNELYYQLYLVALAAVTADTWATEVGVLFSQKPRFITNFKTVEPGISGAVSLLGTLASLVGSFLISTIGFLFLKIDAYQFLLIIVSGFLGSVIDSYIGATIQGQYQCTVCNNYTERKIHCGQPARLIKGYRFINNDLVNFAAALFSVAIYFLFIYFQSA